jgi:uncharacterized protein YcfL
MKNKRKQKEKISFQFYWWGSGVVLYNKNGGSTVFLISCDCLSDQRGCGCVSLF